MDNLHYLEEEDVEEVMEKVEEMMEKLEEIGKLVILLDSL